jgi:hypothetical protein
MNDRNLKQVLLEGGYQWEGGRQKESVKEEMHIILMYEHRIMKHVEIVLRRREIRGNDGG